MKGEIKPIGTNTSGMSDKVFNVKISDAKVFERSTRILRQSKENAFTDATLKSHNKEKEKTDLTKIKFAELIQRTDDEDKEGKHHIKNPFEWFEDNVSKRVLVDFKDDMDKFKIENKFIYDFFKNVDLVSDECLSSVLADINKMVDEFYNILSEQVNEFVYFFLTILDAYVSLDIEDKKFFIFHENIVNFFNGSLKNRTEEMFYIFKNVFIKKIFELMNSGEYREKIYYFCDILYKILEPIESQQVDFFKLFKENIKEEETLYESFSILHDLLSHYSENVMDVCLFYILNGISSQISDLRYYSLYMLAKYMLTNINFFFNFEKALTKISKNERDRENCLLLIKMCCIYLKNVYLSKNKPKEANFSQSQKRIVPNQVEEESALINYQNELQIANNIIKNILMRYIGDSLVMLLACTTISEHLYDNAELYKLFLFCVFSCDDNVHKFIFYEDELEESINVLLQYTKFRVKPEFIKFKDWHAHIFLKAFDIMIKEDANKNSFDDKDYHFIEFILEKGINPIHSEIWKNHFKFSKLILNDMKNNEKCQRSLKIMEVFFLSETISKHILDENYDHFQDVLKEIIKDSTTNGTKCQEMIATCLKNWINHPNTSSILRDGLRKLLEILNVNNSY